jgi:hypothetical protein
MKEKMVIDVQGGGTLQVTLGNRAVGNPVTIPPDVTSVTVVVRDSAASAQGMARRREKLERRNKAGRRQRRGGDDE